MAEEKKDLLRTKVYERVNELMAAEPGRSRSDVFKQVQEEMGFKSVSSVSANYYRAKDEDPNAEPSKRGRPRKNKTEAAAAAAASPAGETAATAEAPKTTRRSSAKTTSTRSRSTGTRAKSATATRRSTRGRASTTTTSQAVDILNGLIQENESLRAEVEDLRSRLAQVQKLVDL